MKLARKNHKLPRVAHRDKQSALKQGYFPQNSIAWKAGSPPQWTSIATWRVPHILLLLQAAMVLMLRRGW